MMDDMLAGVPRVVLRPAEDRNFRILRAIQRLVLEHPVACQAAFAALVAEGRSFAETHEGRALQEQLSRSPLLQRARTGFDAATLWMLEERSAQELPSTYVDVLLMAAEGNGLEPLIDRLLREPLGGPRHADR